MQLSGFLDKDAPSFCLTLWKLCISAQNDPEGIPRELVEARKEVIMRERVSLFQDAPRQHMANMCQTEKEQAHEKLIARQNEERERERERDRVRDRERNERRGRGRGGDGGRFGRDSDRWQRRDSRSPPRRRRRDDDDFSRPTRGADTWAPSSRRDDRGPRRRRSPSYSRSPSRSRSPPRRRRRMSSPSPSRSPPRRRRRNTSSVRSSSGEPPRRRNGRDRSRSASRRSPPPSKRARRRSPSPARSQRDGAADSRPGSSSSGTSVSKEKASNGTESKDLLSKTNGGKDGRLSQEPKEVGSESA